MAHKIPSRAVAREMVRKLGGRYRLVLTDDGYVIQKQGVLGWRGLSRDELARALGDTDKPN